MIKSILLALVLLCEAQGLDLREEDKQKHIAATFAVSMIASNIAYKYDFTTNQSWWIGFASGMIVGLGKELYDSRDGGTGFDSADMTADAIGSSLGSSTVLFRYYF